MRLVGASDLYIQAPFVLEITVASIIGGIAGWGVTSSTDDDGSSLMAGRLDTGVRHLDALDAAFASLNS